MLGGGGHRHNIIIVVGLGQTDQTAAAPAQKKRQFGPPVTCRLTSQHCTAGGAVSMAERPIKFHATFMRNRRTVNVVLRKHSNSAAAMAAVHHDRAGRGGKGERLELGRSLKVGLGMRLLSVFLIKSYTVEITLNERGKYTLANFMYSVPRMSSYTTSFLMKIRTN